jgi:hypothetical protein
VTGIAWARDRVQADRSPGSGGRVTRGDTPAHRRGGRLTGGQHAADGDPARRGLFRSELPTMDRRPGDERSLDRRRTQSSRVTRGTGAGDQR